MNLRIALPVLTTLLVTLGLGARGQGTINFVNRIVGVLDAPVADGRTGNRLTGAEGWVAVLYGSAPGGTMGQLGQPIPFRDGIGAGYWPGETRVVPGVAEGGTAQLQVKVFNTFLGSTLEQAQAVGVGGWSQSNVLPAVLTGGGLTPPMPMVGLQAFEVPIVPEPNPAVLFLLGAVFLIRRRRK